MAERSILITGCSSGIGYHAAHGLKARGWRVFATCRRAADCDRLRAEGLESFPLDYADEDSIASALAEVLTRTGGTLDALYNNGAFASPGLVEDLPRGALREIFEVNLFGYHDLTRRVIPVMRAQGHGRIINCSSVLGLVGLQWRGAYVATKFAMEGLTDVLRMEMEGTGIHVSLIEKIRQCHKTASFSYVVGVTRDLCFIIGIIILSPLRFTCSVPFRKIPGKRFSQSCRKV